MHDLQTSHGGIHQSGQVHPDSRDDNGVGKHGACGGNLEPRARRQSSSDVMFPLTPISGDAP